MYILGKYRQALDILRYLSSWGYRRVDATAAWRRHNIASVGLLSVWSSCAGTCPSHLAPARLHVVIKACWLGVSLNRPTLTNFVDLGLHLTRLSSITLTRTWVDQIRYREEKRCWQWLTLKLRSPLLRQYVDCRICCTGSAFQTECSTSSQSRCSNVCRTEHRNTWSTAVFRSPTSSLVKSTFTLRQSTSLDCAVLLPTKHIRSLGLLCWNALPDDQRNFPRPVAQCRWLPANVKDSIVHQILVYSAPLRCLMKSCYKFRPNNDSDIDMNRH